MFSTGLFFFTFPPTLYHGSSFPTFLPMWVIFQCFNTIAIVMRIWSGTLLWFWFAFPSDCSHEIKRCLLLGRKVMTNRDSILKSRDITLPTKLHLVKAMVFPVVIYGCESWIVKKAEHRRTDAFELWCWRSLLRESLGLQGDPTNPS